MSHMSYLLNASLIALALATSACSPVPQKPLESGMVRVNLAADVGNDVKAYRVSSSKAFASATSALAHTIFRYVITSRCRAAPAAAACLMPTFARA